MQEKIKSEGECLFCGKMFAKAGINRHLTIHLKEKEAAGKPGESFLVKVETDKRWGHSPYFLSLWIDGEAKMKDLDTFLRKIWLECCRHMSAFSKRKKGNNMFDIMDAYEYLKKENVAKYEKMMEEMDGTVHMNRKVKDILHKDSMLEYEYDFGSSTELSIIVMGEYSVKADKKIVLLSRNEPLEIMCSSCEKVPATQVCTTCMYEEDAIFCDKCAKKHAKKCDDFEDGASLPIVNSPRMGVCGYTGGTIDMERDGVFVQK
jgi:hypothetical protein